MVSCSLSVGKGSFCQNLNVFIHWPLRHELSFHSLQLHPIEHPRLFNHSSQYHIIKVIRRYILGIQANAFILPRIRFSQLEGDTVDGGCCLSSLAECHKKPEPLSPPCSELPFISLLAQDDVEDKGQNNAIELGVGFKIRCYGNLRYRYWSRRR